MARETVNVAKLLECLDFNGVHSGDVIARVYFQQSATAIRALQREVAHWRRLGVAEEGRRLEADVDADIVTGVLARIVAKAQEAQPPKGV